MPMRSMFKTMASGWRELFAGAGYVAPPAPGNRSNAPADPSVVTGNYEFIIPQMYPSQNIVNVPVIPPFGRDWGQLPLNLYGLSGLEGGGSTGLVPNVNQGAVFYYDENTGNYVDLSMLVGVQQP